MNAHDIDKNIKDLEFHWLSNLFITTVVIYATFVITLATKHTGLAQPVAPHGKPKSR